MWLVAASGGEPVLLTQRPALSGSWSRDGREVYFNGEGDDRRTIYAVSAESGAERLLAILDGRSGVNVANTAPDTDGEYLYYIWYEAVSDIWVMDVEGGDRKDPRR